MSKRVGCVGWGSIAFGLLVGVLASAAPSQAQSAGNSGDKRPAPSGTGGVGLVPVAGGPGSAGAPPINGGGGGASGAAGGGASGGGTSGGGACGGFMQCAQPQQGVGAMIGFVISLAPEVAGQPIDQLRITMKIGSTPVSWSPLTLPNTGEKVSFPFTTSNFQTCADQYGEATSTVEGLVAGKVVASAAGTLTTENCVAFVVTVELQAVPGATQEPMAGSTGSGNPAMAGSSGGGAATGASAAGQGGAGGAHSSGAGGSSGSVAGSAAPVADIGDESGCGCELVGTQRAHGAGPASCALIAIALLTRARRKRR